MAKVLDPNHYVKCREGIWTVVWNQQAHSLHTTARAAYATLNRLKKIQRETGAEPRPLSHFDRMDWLNTPKKEPVTRAVTGLQCPDCGASMYIKEGRFGLFYGCERYAKTLCRGSVSADRHGVPLGVPVDSDTRRARYILRQILSRPEQTPRRVADQTLNQCRAAIAELLKDSLELVEFVHNLPDHLRRTRLERLASNQDRLDEMIGDVGVDPLES